MELIPVALYIFFLSFILLYSIAELGLLFNFLFRLRKFRSLNPEPPIKEEDLPKVTIQLPVYNEVYVVERLIDAVARLDYPLHLLEIQVLDDSTDESAELAAKRILYWKENGISIHHIRRNERTGFKAGALDYGIRLASGAFIAIFDADFIPPAYFLRRTIPFFSNEKVGVVQTRWGHLNKNYSLLTRLQAFGLDAHFSIEQGGRNSAGHFINFNGTAGVWRKSCIEDSGGWSADTLTEDLDLSYRAQLLGWKFIYLEEIVSPAELPAEMNALKAQQYRWSKGAAECARKNLGKVLKNPVFGTATKIQAFFHLLNSFLFICIFSIGLLTFPVIMVAEKFPEYGNLYSLFSVFYLSMIFISIYYFASEIHHAKNKVKGFFAFIVLYPVFLCVSMGLSLYNTIGVLEGYTGRKSAFVRTPKFNITGKKGTWSKSKYAIQKLRPVVLLEGFFFLLFGIACFEVAKTGFSLSLVFYGMLTIGYGFVFLGSIIHSKT